MNKNLHNALFGMGKVDALMSAYENTYLELEVVPEEIERANQAIYAFHALWDAVRNVSRDLDLLAGDEKVIDAIYAVDRVRYRTAERGD